MSDDNSEFKENQIRSRMRALLQNRAKSNTDEQNIFDESLTNRLSNDKRGNSSKAFDLHPISGGVYPYSHMCTCNDKEEPEMRIMGGTNNPETIASIIKSRLKNREKSEIGVPEMSIYEEMQKNRNKYVKKFNKKMKKNALSNIDINELTKNFKGKMTDEKLKKIMKEIKMKKKLRKGKRFLKKKGEESDTDSDTDSESGSESETDSDTDSD